MLKKIGSIFLVIVMVLGITACGSDDNGAKSGKAREKNNVTVTPTVEATPTETPTPTDGPVTTPTAEPVMLPVPDVTEGPAYVIARGDGCDRYSDYYTGDGPAFDAEVDYLYITETGFDELAKSIRAQNLEAYNTSDRVRGSAAELLDQVTYEFSAKWYETSYIEVTRNDSKVFAYTRATDSYLGGAQNYWSHKGYVYNTETGEQMDLSSMISDMKGFAEDVLVLFGAYENEYGYWENWQDRIREAVAEGTIGWVPTDDGLEIWCNNGALAPYVVGEVCVEYPVEKYYTRFATEMIGAYGSYEKKPSGVEGLIGNISDWGFMRSEMYRDLYYGVRDGLGKYYWQDLADYLTKKGVAFEGYDEKKGAEFESDAYAIFYDPEFNDRFYIFFWPEDKNDYESRQIMNSISIQFEDYEFFLLIDAGEDGKPVYQIIDCSFDGKRDAAKVLYDGDAMDVMIITMPCYYDDIRRTKY
ncbi:MAG: hypothetical protein IJL03_05890 [Lachnospiraceae bacterium]|nr:hypothetical protein [Lachnospiraceae bacterium]